MDAEDSLSGRLQSADTLAVDISPTLDFQKFSRDRMQVIVVETRHSTQVLGQILAVLDAWNAIAFTISVRSDRAGQFVDLCCVLPTVEACVMIPRALRAIENVRYAALEAVPAD